MRASPLVCTIVLLALLAACGGKEPVPPATAAGAASLSASSTPPEAAPAGLTIVPLKLVASREGSAKLGFKVLELQADGTMLQDGKAHGKIFPDRVVGEDGKTMFAVAPDGTFTTEGRHEHAKLTPSDALSNSRGESFVIGDDGAVSFKRKTGEVVPVAAKFESMPANGKRAAAAMIAASRIGYFVFATP